MSDGPYKSGAPGYLRNGWQGILPVGRSPMAKWPPITGYTGADGAWPSPADVMSWGDGEEGSRNIGLRLPPHVIGIDVDGYGDKQGAATLDDAQAVWDRLPSTWVTTARWPTGSGIYLYAVPPGLKWPGQVGAGIEIIQYRHRYAMVWPSIHPDGMLYEWITPAGDKADRIPHADELPELSASWINGLTHGEAEVDVLKLDLPDVAVTAWLAAAGSGQPCAAVQRAMLRAFADLSAGGSRHEAGKGATHRLMMLAAEGHTGVGSALADVKQAFSQAVNHDPDRMSEWHRLITGAVKIAAVRGVQPLDPCTFYQGPPASTASTADKATPTLVGSEQAGSARVLSSSSAPVSAVSIPTTVPIPAPVLTVVPREAERPAEAPADAVPVNDPALALEVAMQRVRRAAKRLLDDEEAAASFRVPPSTLDLSAELALPDEPESFRVEQVLPTGGNALLTAGFKAGKSTLVNNLARSLADGVPFLGEFTVTPLAPGERVALWNYEVGRGQYRTWLRDTGIENTDAVAVLNVRGFRMPITVPKVEDFIVAWLIERAVRVWVIDPFARAFTGNSENDNTEVGRWLDTIDVIKERAGVGELVLPAHTGRSTAEEGAERARGATRLDDWADVRWMLNKNDLDARFFMATGRDVDYPERELSFNDKTRRLTIVGGNRKASRAERTKNAVFAAVSARPGMGSRELREAVAELLNGARGGDVDAAAKALLTSGHLKLVALGNNKKGHYPDTPRPFGNPS